MNYIAKTCGNFNKIIYKIMRKQMNKKGEDLRRRLESAIYFFSEKIDYERSLSELKLAGDIVVGELNKKTRKERELEFEKRNVKLLL